MKNLSEKKWKVENKEARHLTLSIEFAKCPSNYLNYLSDYSELGPLQKNRTNLMSLLLFALFNSVNCFSS